MHFSLFLHFYATTQMMSMGQHLENEIQHKQLLDAVFNALTAAYKNMNERLMLTKLVN